MCRTKEDDDQEGEEEADEEDCGTRHGLRK
jgi:hypothetical protein